MFHVLGKMSDRTQSPEYQSIPYDYSRANAYSHVCGQEGLGNPSSSFQLPHGVLSDPSLLYSKPAYGGISAASAQAFLPFPPVRAGPADTNGRNKWLNGGGCSDPEVSWVPYRDSDLQPGDFGQRKHWYPFAAPEYTGHVPGVTAATQPTNLSPPMAETREQIKLPEIKIEKDTGEEHSTEMKVQQYPMPAAPTGAHLHQRHHGVFYSAAWNPSFWPGVPHINPPGTSTQNPTGPSASSPSMSPSPPINGAPRSALFSVSSAHAAAEPQAQTPATNTRSSGSSSGGCSDSEEVSCLR